MKKTILERAREVFDTEVCGVNAVRDNLGESFEALVDRCMRTLSSGGKLVLTGVGKSGYIGKKIAATAVERRLPRRCSLHPVEAASRRSRHPAEERPPDRAVVFGGDLRSCSLC